MDTKYTRIGIEVPTEAVVEFLIGYVENEMKNRKKKDTTCVVYGIHKSSQDGSQYYILVDYVPVP